MEELKDQEPDEAPEPRSVAVQHRTLPHKGNHESSSDAQAIPRRTFYGVLCIGFGLVVVVVFITAFPMFDRANERKKGDDTDPVVRRTRSPTSSFAPTPFETTMKPSLSPTIRQPTYGDISTASTPVEYYGRLQVNGTEIKSSRLGITVQLAGMSLFWSNEDFGAEEYYSAATIEELATTWNCSIVRAAMGVEEHGGYVGFPTANEERVRTVVEAAIDHGIYVIIDFHSHQAEDYVDEALAFFEDMVNDYGSYPNVMYEIYNEPDDDPSFSTWADDIKPYAEEIITSIRDNPNDENALILVGTEFYSQNVDVASEDPITIDDNVAYVLHFYAGSHGEDLREQGQTALDNGVALFVTEFGTVDASGNGTVDTESTREWIDWLDERFISYANWAINDKRESASVLKPGTGPSGWTESDYTTSGLLIRSILDDTALANSKRLQDFLTPRPTSQPAVPSAMPTSGPVIPSALPTPSPTLLVPSTPTA